MGEMGGEIELHVKMLQFQLIVQPQKVKILSQIIFLKGEFNHKLALAVFNKSLLLASPNLKIF